MKRSPAIVVAGLLVSCVSEAHLWGATLSNNLDQPTGSTEIVTASTFVASSFGTGNYSSILKSAALLLQVTGQPNPVIALYSDMNGEPGSDLGQLLSPSSYGTKLQVTSFGGNQLLLAANSTYWIVAEAASSGSYQWAYSSNDVGTGPGFQLNWAISYQEDTDWFPSDVLPMQMLVQDSSTVMPEPGSILLLAFGLAVTGFAVLRRRYRA